MLAGISQSDIGADTEDLRKAASAALLASHYSLSLNESDHVKPRELINDDFVYKRSRGGRNAGLKHTNHDRQTQTSRRTLRKRDEQPSTPSTPIALVTPNLGFHDQIVNAAERGSAESFEMKSPDFANSPLSARNSSRLKARIQSLANLPGRKLFEGSMSPFSTYELPRIQSSPIIPYVSTDIFQLGALSPPLDPSAPLDYFLEPKSPLESPARTLALSSEVYGTPLSSSVPLPPAPKNRSKADLHQTSTKSKPRLAKSSYARWTAEEESQQDRPLSVEAFQCDYPGCKAAPFLTQYLLNSHKNVHSDSRPHFCPMEGCKRATGGLGFKRKNEMMRHALVHSSPGYVCPFCPDREHKYPRPDNLQRHVRVHHQDQDADNPLLRDVLSLRPEGETRGRRKRTVPTKLNMSGMGASASQLEPQKEGHIAHTNLGLR